MPVDTNPRLGVHLQGLPQRISAHRRDGWRPLVATQREALDSLVEETETPASAANWQSPSNTPEEFIIPLVKKLRPWHSVTPILHTSTAGVWTLLSAKTFGAMLREFSDTSTNHSGTGAMYSTTGSTDTAGIGTMYSLVGQDVLHQQRRHCDQRMSSRVPGPTVNRRMPVNSGAAKIGATTLCLHGCVLTQTMRNIVSCTEATCLVVLKRHTPAVRLCGSKSHRKPTAGHRPSTVPKGAPRQPGPCTPSSWTAANAAITPSRRSSLLKNCKKILH